MIELICYLVVQNKGKQRPLVS